MNKKVLVGVLFFLMINSVSALSTSTEIMYAGESVNFEGFNIYLSSSSNGEKILVQVDQKSLFIDLGIDSNEYETYRSNADDFIKYSSPPSVSYKDLIISLEEVCFDVEPEVDCGRVNFFTKTVEPSYKLRFKLKEPEIKVKRTYSSKEVIYGEEIIVTTEIQNKGDVDVTNFVYEEEYPSSIKIKANSVVQVNGQTIRFTEPFLKKGDSRSFKHRIYLYDTLEYTLKGKYNYKYRDELFEEFTDSKSIKLKNILTTKLSGPSSLKPGNSGKISLSVTNNVEGKVDFKYRLKIPEEFKIKKLRKFEKVSDGIYEFADRIEENEELTASLELESEIQKVYTLEGELDSFYLIQNPTEYSTKDLVVTEDAGDLSITIIPKDNSLLETEDSYVEVHFTRDEDIKVSNIDFIINASKIDNKEFFEQKSGEIKNLNEDFTNKYFYFTLPELNTTDITFVVDGEYDIVYPNSSIEHKSFSVKKSLKAYAIEDAIFVRTILLPSTINQGEVAKLTLSVENKLDSRSFRKIYAKDIVPDDLKYKDILTETYFNLEPLDRKSIYTYEIKAPYKVNESTSTIISQIFFPNFNITHKNNLVSKIKLKSPQLSISQSFDDEIKVGKLTRASYKVINSGDVEMRNIFLKIPLSENLELFNSDKDYFIEVLQPGEEVNILRDYRGKYAEKLELNPFIADFEDEYTNNFHLEEKMDFKENYIVEGDLGCYVEGIKSVKEQRGNDIKYKINFRNNCNNAVKVNMNDKEINIPSDETRTIEFNRIKMGNNTFEKGEVFSYEFDSKKYTTLTNSLEVENISVINFQNSSIIFNETKISDADVNDDDSLENETLNLEKKKYSFKINENFFFAVFVIILIPLIMFFLYNFILKFRTDPTLDKDSQVDLKENKGIKDAFSEGSSRESQILENKQISLNESKKSSEIESPKITQNISKVGEYVEKALNSGISREEIKENLKSKGWDEIIINKYIEK